MIRSDRRSWPLAVWLALLSGYVDAIGFLQLGGYFVSFMSGNGTMLAVRLAAPDVHVSGAVEVLAMLLALFVTGVAGGTLIRLALPRVGQVAVLVLVALLLGTVAIWGVRVAPAMVLAMGAANATFERDGEVSIGVTYMTGTLVKIGQHLAQAIAGRQRWAWLPYLMLWSGFLVGAGLGALAFPIWGLASLVAAVAAALIAAVAAWRLCPAA
ncbi:YoaK family protein [Sphingomonas fuzhouensis]|uniref:YoaK family protein n=1 Tax=Sphingomonas fuzhouensis TaxID=3106033 RepID=UPI002AFEAF79|nr:YoaK family protein [Sphingomonas sp. SGZ-02]